jgi:predicted membrane channel-forming protein YqfA (hemolysin III family)
MQTQANPLHARMRLSGAFIILGLVIQALSLLWNHPLSFIAFVTVGGLLLAIGIVLYLLTLVNMAAAPPEEAPGAQPQISRN